MERLFRNRFMLVCLMVVLVDATAFAQLSLPSSVQANAGGVAQGGGLTMTATVGQGSPIGNGAAGTLTLGAGFIPTAGQALAVSASNPPTTGTAGSALTVTGTATGATQFYIEYRIGRGSWTRVDFSGFVNGTAAIPGSAVTANGLDYRIVAANSAGNRDTVRNGSLSFFSVAVGVNDGALSHPTVGGDQVSAYRLFSVPANLTNKAFNAFFSGANALGDNGTGWRFFRYNDRTAVELNGGSTDPLNVGAAFFLITRSSKAVQTKQGTTNRLSDVATTGISLNSGWNLVGNPMPYDINLSDFELVPPSAGNLTQDAYYWSGPGGWVQTGLVLKAWEGLAIRCTSNAVLRLSRSNGQLNRPTDGTLQEDAGRVVAKRNGESSTSGAANNWLVHLVADDGVTVDGINYIGVKPGASDEFDGLDRYQPPLVPGGVALYFHERQWGQHSDYYATDIRSPSDRGHTWEATLSGRENSMVSVSLEEIEAVPSQFQMFALVDDGMIHDLRATPNFSVKMLREPRTVKFVIGTEEYVSEQSSTPLVPESFMLFQNYPNPFNPSTTIRYGLPKAAHVTLKVFNMLGQEVATLVDAVQEKGYKSVEFPPSGGIAGRLSSGTYIYRLQAGDFNSAKKLLLLK